MDSATATLLILGSLIGVLATFPTGRTFLKDWFKGVIQWWVAIVVAGLIFGTVYQLSKEPRALIEWNRP